MKKEKKTMTMIINKLVYVRIKNHLKSSNRYELTLVLTMCKKKMAIQTTILYFYIIYLLRTYF